MITRLNVGGPAIQALLLTRELDPSRYDAILVAGRTPAHEGDMRRLRETQPVDVIEIPDLVREISPLRDIRAFLALVRLMRRHHPHIVHTHMAKAGLLGRLAAWCLRTPVVVHTFHGTVLQGYFGHLTTAVFVALERVLARMSTRLLSISPGVSAELRRLRVAVPPKVVELPLGLDLRPFLDGRAGALRSELLIAADRPLVGIVARLVPIKAVDVFLRAAAFVHASRSDAVFVIVGDGEERDRLQALASAILPPEAVHFLGWRGDLPAVYMDLDVVALSSRNEGTPVAVIEALACARAIVATSVGGVPDVLGTDAGVLVPEGDDRALGAAILALLSDPRRRRELGERGRARVYPAYDSSLLVARIDALYRSLVRTGPVT